MIYTASRIKELVQSLNIFVCIFYKVEQYVGRPTFKAICLAAHYSVKRVANKAAIRTIRATYKAM